MMIERICEELDCSVEELRNMHFFAQMEGVRSIPILGIGISDGNCTWRECVIDEERFPLEENYKITLRAIDGSYGYEHYYMMDFLSMLEQGAILVTNQNNAHVEHIVWEEPIGNTGYIYHHEADVVVSW